MSDTNDFDNGYWYLVATKQDPDLGGEIPDFPPSASGWCAWYADGKAAVRSPVPVEGVNEIPGSVEDVVSANRPRGRVGGQ